MKTPSPNSSLRAVINWFKDWPNLIIVLLVLLSLLLHLVLVPSAESVVFDENHYVTEARSIIYKAEITQPAHPPLGKLFISSGIIVFGDNPWGWRIPSIIFSTASILIFYFICRKLTGKLAAILASALFTFDTLAFFISGLGILDIFSLTFMLLAFLFYLQNRYVFSGITLALSGLCKMTGLLGIFVILVHWLLIRRKESPKTIGLFLASTLMTFLLLMPLLDFIATRELVSPFDRLWLMLSIHEQIMYGLPICVPEWASAPWEWILPFQNSGIPAYDGIMVYISPLLKISIIPSIGYMVYEFIKNRTNTSLFVILWFAGTYLIWIPIVLATDRITYAYYFVPTVGAVCIAIGVALSKLWEIQSKVHFTGKHPLIDLIFRRSLQVFVIGYLAVYVLIFLVSWSSLYV